MSAGPLIPQLFWFRMALRCPRVDSIPRRDGRGELLGLPPECALPALGRVEGREGWAEVRVGWNPAGLAVSVEVTGKSGPIMNVAGQPEMSDGVQVWVDTRDTRDVHRASKYCHRFAAQLGAGRGDKSVEVNVLQKNISRALAEPPRARLDSILARAEARSRPGGWLLELFFKAEALHGFDAEVNRRLGFMIQVTDPERGDQFLGVGREFPVGEDPSLWATLELVGR